MTEGLVYIVDDDEAVRDSLAALLTASGLPAEVFADPTEFLAAVEPCWSGCLVADLRMPGMDGLTLRRALADKGAEMPVIIITAHGDVSSAVEALRGGALDFLEKPFDDGVFLQRVREALRRDAARRAERAEMAEACARLGVLSDRERAVARLMIEGLPNKAIALRLDIGVRTVETHRAHIFDKLAIKSVPQLMRLWDRAHGRTPIEDPRA